MRGAVSAGAGFAFILCTQSSSAQLSRWNVDYRVDAAVIVSLAVGARLVGEIPVDTSTRWQSELLGIDHDVRSRFSASAAAISDAFGLLTIAGPMFAVVGTGIDESVAHRGVIYAQALAATAMLTNTAKYVVQRPRPYAYGSQSRVVAMTSGQQEQSHLSFFSGHSAISFTAAVAGSYLYGAQSPEEASRASLWGAELALASATANLRVRAGKHFYSDIIVGALIGAGVGFGVPRLHLASAQQYTPSGAELATMAGGVVAGTVAAWLIPVSDDICVSLEEGRIQVVPTPLRRGAALTVAGQF